jgi:hypothetical protein
MRGEDEEPQRRERGGVLRTGADADEAAHQIRAVVVARESMPFAYTPGAPAASLRWK